MSLLRAIQNWIRSWGAATATAMEKCTCEKRVFQQAGRTWASICEHEVEFARRAQRECALEFNEAEMCVAIPDPFQRRLEILGGKKP